jgi:hypothetical protein
VFRIWDNFLHVELRRNDLILLSLLGLRLSLLRGAHHGAHAYACLALTIDVGSLAHTADHTLHLLSVGVAAIGYDELLLFLIVGKLIIKPGFPLWNLDNIIKHLAGMIKLLEGRT